MSAASIYLLDISDEPGELADANIEKIFDEVWRCDFSTSGFAVLDSGLSLGSHGLRSLMLELKDRLSQILEGRSSIPFTDLSLGRLDQQETSKFHLEGAPEQSLLVLGYEPSKVRSRLSLADYARYAHNIGIEPRRFLEGYNPMYRKGEELLTPYVTELPQPVEGHGRIVLINHSSLPFSEAGTNSRRVLHKAEIPDPDDVERRVVNSMMLSADGPEEVGERSLREFVETEEVSRTFYG